MRRHGAKSDLPRRRLANILTSRCELLGGLVGVELLRPERPHHRVEDAELERSQRSDHNAPR